MKDTNEDDKDMSDSDDSDSDDDSEDEGPQGVDRLQVSQGIDIPFGLKIPIVSQLAKEARLREIKSKKDKTAEDLDMEAKERKRQITDFIEKDDDELETHFVENPFIKIREKATRK